ncbi:DUF2191 domain-containing protein [filamentous cyanobacterium CCP3]|nr:DUF2191 domain-containing protein [filamentous cyanobacterium CCP3]
MKTTVEINDALLLRARQVAAARQQTLKSILEAALRQYLDDSAPSQTPFKLRKHTFEGQGLQSAAQGDWPTVREQIYERRGG